MARFDGVWDTVTKTPMGDQVAQLTISTEGGTLTGTSSNATGAMALEDGKVDGDRATWTMKMTTPFPMTLEADVTIDGDTLSGGVKAGMFGTSPITGTRKS
ncbi:hypothetical protein [Novosphingobium sp. BL-52-GroH]|uniref:hypothetical protein n=1 Tax=Novosphingobium sp. BL-52-GroH TaxID=3349877 RepID=UPI00384E1596